MKGQYCAYEVLVKESGVDRWKRRLRVWEICGGMTLRGVLGAEGGRVKGGMKCASGSRGAVGSMVSGSGAFRFRLRGPVDDGGGASVGASGRRKGSRRGGGWKCSRG